MTKNNGDQTPESDHERSVDSSDQKPTYTDLALHGRSLNRSAFSKLHVLRDTNGTGYLQVADRKIVYRLDGPQAKTVVLQHGAEAGCVLRSYELNEVMDGLRAGAQLSTDRVPVWHRVARIEGGIEIDVGDDVQNRIQVTRGGVRVVTDSPTLFARPPTMRELVLPASSGHLRQLDFYLNLSPSDVLLLKAWIGYVLAHPKVATTAYPILVLGGDQGSGKSFLCSLIQRLIDPSTVGVRMFPRTPQDLAIAAQQAHLLMFDNVREIKTFMSDALCIAATGGVIETRRLYTDSETIAHRLHVAVILNGIHAFVDQPDLAQRCVPLQLRSLDPRQRHTESALTKGFETHLPGIFRGLLDLIAGVLGELPKVEATNPERLIGFSHWLAAMERVDGVPDGVYQAQYSAAVKDSLLDSLLEHPLAAAIFELMVGRESWSGTPTELLVALRWIEGNGSYPFFEWPRNPIALSKQLQGLQAGLRSQGLDVRLSRGHERRITIVRLAGVDHE